MHLATLMHSNHAICIVGVSRGGEICQKGARYCQGVRDFLYFIHCIEGS